MSESLLSGTKGVLVTETRSPYFLRWMSKKANMQATALEIDALMALSLNDADIVQPTTHCDVKQHHRPQPTPL